MYRAAFVIFPWRNGHGGTTFFRNTSGGGWITIARSLGAETIPGGPRTKLFRSYRTVNIVAKSNNPPVPSRPCLRK